MRSKLCSKGKPFVLNHELVDRSNHDRCRRKRAIMLKVYGLRRTMSCLAIMLATLTLSACQRREDPSQGPVNSSPVTTVQEKQFVRPPAATQTAPQVNSETSAPAAVTLLKEPITSLLMEEQAEALPVWRNFAAQKPTLLLFSGRVLQPLPGDLGVEVDHLLQQGDDQELVRRMARPVSDQLLSPGLGVAAAMAQGYFSRVIWVIPVGKGMEILSLDDFRKGLRQQAPGWSRDIYSFEKTVNGAYSGMLGGVSVDVVAIDRLPIVKEPLLVHIDAGFFYGIYLDELKTPLYPLLTDHFKKVADRGYQALGVTIARANLSFDVPLRMRFLGDDIAAIIASPELLDEPTKAMQLRGEMDYRESFFQPKAIIEKAQALQKIAARDADSFYRLYRAQLQMNQPGQGLSALGQAVSLDPLYALEYFELVNQKVRHGEQDAALVLLDKSIQALPEHALIGVRKAQLLVEMERGEEAVPLLRELEALPWSEYYYPDMHQEIEALLRKAGKD